MRRSTIIVVLAVLGLIAPCGASGGSTMYGITASDGVNAQIVLIDTLTGQASSLFEVAIPTGFTTGPATYHAPSGLLMVVLSNATTNESRLLVVNPTAQIGDSAPISGLPVGEAKTSGLEYQPADDELLLTFGATGSFEENKIARLGVDGSVQEVSVDIGIGDIDAIVWDATTSQLVACDFNSVAIIPRMVALSDIFDVPSWVEYGNPPNNGNIGDVAIDPTSGRVYAVGYVAPGGELLEVAGDRYVTIGTFDLGVQIAGIAFAPLLCPGDINGCGTVDINDLLIVLGAWGTDDELADIAPPGGDGIVNVEDLLLILAEWGPC